MKKKKLNIIQRIKLKLLQKKMMGKYGLKGDTGLTGNYIGILHLNAPYDCNGMYFVQVEDDSVFGEQWTRVPKNQIKSEHKIINCHYCDKPAVSLDHSWPWQVEETVCEKHFKNH